jgi:hypothetical protein
MSSDAELVARICDHDESAFEALSTRYRESIYRHVLSILHEDSVTEDVVQEVILEQGERNQLLQQLVERLPTEKRAIRDPCAPAPGQSPKRSVLG